MAYIASHVFGIADDKIFINMMQTESCKKYYSHNTDKRDCQKQTLKFLWCDV